MSSVSERFSIEWPGTVPGAAGPGHDAELPVWPNLEEMRDFTAKYCGWLALVAADQMLLQPEGQTDIRRYDSRSTLPPSVLSGEVVGLETKPGWFSSAHSSLPMLVTRGAHIYDRRTREWSELTTSSQQMVVALNRIYGGVKVFPNSTKRNRPDKKL